MLDLIPSGIPMQTQLFLGIDLQYCLELFLNCVRLEVHSADTSNLMSYWAVAMRISLAFSVASSSQA